MELLQLRYFCTAAQTENFSHTARLYCVPPSDISQAIKRLEGELGVRLFDRSANRISLSQEGKMLYKDIKPLLEGLENAVKRIADREALQGEICLLIRTNRRIVTKAIERFRQEHPSVNFRIMHGDINRNEHYDLIVTDKESDPQHCKRIVREQMCMALSKQNPLAQKKALTLSDMANERFITMQDDSSLYQITHRLCRKAGFTPHIAIQTDDPFYVRKYVELNLGVAIAPMVSWEGLFSESIRCVPIPGLWRETFVVWPQGSYLSPTVQAFLELF